MYKTVGEQSEEVREDSFNEAASEGTPTFKTSLVNRMNKSLVQEDKNGALVPVTKKVTPRDLKIMSVFAVMMMAPQTMSTLAKFRRSCS